LTTWFGRIVAWSLANRPVVVVATLVFALFGVRAALTLPVDAVPDVTSVQVQVITSAPALSPVEVEQYVSVPVERAMAGIEKTTEVRSISKYGLSVVTVVFEDGTDIYFARQRVNERMTEAAEAVPMGYGRPEMGPTSSGLGEIYQFVVRNEQKTIMELEELLDWQIAPVLRSVKGVVEVNSFGGEDRQYQILLDPKRLQAAGVSVAEVVTALEKSNANAGGGYIEHAREHFVIGTDGLVKDLEDLRQVVIGATPQGVRGSPSSSRRYPPEPASSHFTIARCSSIAPSARSRRTSSKALCSSSSCCCSCSAIYARGSSWRRSSRYRSSSRWS
jgi:heavy metal efflux system protein